MEIISSTEIEVVSFAFRAENYFLENHQQIPLFEQYRSFKNEFRNSGGRKVNVNIYSVDRAQVYFEGQDSILIKEGAINAEFSVGTGVSRLENCNCLINAYENSFAQYRFNDVIFSMQLGMYNFHHFLLEVFPVIWLYREDFRGKTFVISSSGDSRFVEEIFRFFEIDIKVELIPLRAKCHISNAMLLSHLPNRIYPVELLKEIRDFAFRKIASRLENSKLVENPTIFLGRGDSSRNRRHLLNEDELISYLKINLGSVEVVRPAMVDFRNLTLSLNNATTVIGVTGGALANILWARKMGEFIELVPQNYPGSTESEELSKIFDFKYTKILTSQVQENEFFANSNQVFIPPRIPLRRLLDS